MNPSKEDSKATKELIYIIKCNCPPFRLDQDSVIACRWWISPKDYKAVLSLIKKQIKDLANLSWVEFSLVAMGFSASFASFTRGYEITLGDEKHKMVSIFKMIQSSLKDGCSNAKNPEEESFIMLNTFFILTFLNFYFDEFARFSIDFLLNCKNFKPARFRKNCTLLKEKLSEKEEILKNIHNLQDASPTSAEIAFLNYLFYCETKDSVVKDLMNKKSIPVSKIGHEVARIYGLFS